MYISWNFLLLFCLFSVVLSTDICVRESSDKKCELKESKGKKYSKGIGKIDYLKNILMNGVIQFKR